MMKAVFNKKTSKLYGIPLAQDNIKAPIVFSFCCTNDKGMFQGLHYSPLNFVHAFSLQQSIHSLTIFYDVSTWSTIQSINLQEHVGENWLIELPYQRGIKVRGPHRRRLYQSLLFFFINSMNLFERKQKEMHCGDIMCIMQEFLWILFIDGTNAQTLLPHLWQ